MNETQLIIMQLSYMFNMEATYQTGDFIYGKILKYHPKLCIRQ